MDILQNLVILFLILVFFILSIKWILKKGEYYVRKRRYENSPLSVIDQMDGIEFERYLEMCFQEKGYKVYRTPPSNDYGADLILQKDGKKITLQAKRHRNTVGISAVQEVLGARFYYDADEAIVFTNNYFTKPAKALANKANIRLIGRNEINHFMLYQIK